MDSDLVLLVFLIFSELQNYASLLNVKMLYSQCRDQHKTEDMNHQLDQNMHSHKFYRFINEIPTLLLILIVFVVVFKPL